MPGKVSPYEQACLLERKPVNYIVHIFRQVSRFTDSNEVRGRMAPLVSGKFILQITLRPWSLVPDSSFRVSVVFRSVV